MTDEAKKDAQVEEKKETPGASASASAGKVEIDTSTYIQLLDRLEELESSVAGGGKKDATPKTIDEATAPPQGRVPTPEEIDAMPLSKVLPLIFQGVQSMTQPLAVQIESIRLQNEVDSILRSEERELNKLNEDDKAKATTFEDYKEATFKIAMENPGMSLQRAYKLAREEEEPKVKSNKESKSKHSTLRTLINAQVGEKPHGQIKTTHVPETRAEAASEALAELRKEGRI